MSLHARRPITSCLLILLVGLLGVPSVFAQGPETAPWTTVGSAGTVAEIDLSNVALGSPVAGAVTTRFNGTVHIRYRELEQLDDIVRRLDKGN